MDASIIIVTLNAKELLANCLASIFQHTKDIEYEVIVVDNGSTDGAIDMVKQNFPQVKLLENGENLGFAAANNRGAEKAAGKVLCFFNDDIELIQNSIAAGYQKIITDETVGVLGHHLIFPDKSHQDSVRRYPSLLDQLLILTKLHNFLPNSKIVQKYLCKKFDYTKEQVVDQVMGACMFIRAEDFKKVRMFDERYFVWFEEVDLQRTIKKQLGLNTVYTPDMEMVHVKGATFGKIMSVTNQRRMNNSMRKYFMKNHGFFSYTVITIFQPLSLFLAVIIDVIKKLGGNLQKYKDEQQ